jgi:sulfur-carrier protein
MTTASVQVELPANLCRLARCGHSVLLPVERPVTQRSVLDALEARYPMLEGCLRDHTTRVRRPFIRFFACEQDFSHLQPDDPLPAAVAEGREPFLIVGAIAGG